MRIILTYVAILAASLGLAALLRFYVPSEVWNVPSAVWEVFYGVFGVIYAIVVGFILAELLTRYHRLMSDISNELNALQCIRDFLIYIDENEEAKAEVRKALVEYLHSILDVEWEIMLQNHRVPNSDTTAELYNLMRAVERIRVIDKSDEIAIEKLIDKISDVTEFRTERFDHSARHLSPMVKLLILFMSFVMVVGVIFISVPTAAVHFAMIFAMVTAVYLLYVVIVDLNKPFVGVWNISAKPFRKMLRRLEEAPAS